MQLVLLLLFGSLILGMAFEKLDRKAYMALGVLVLIAACGYLYFKRFL